MNQGILRYTRLRTVPTGPIFLSVIHWRSKNSSNTECPLHTGRNTKVFFWERNRQRLIRSKFSPMSYAMYCNTRDFISFFVIPGDSERMGKISTFLLKKRGKILRVVIGNSGGKKKNPGTNFVLLNIKKGEKKLK